MLAHHRLSVLATSFICLAVAFMAPVMWRNPCGDASRKQIQRTSREDQVVARANADQLSSGAASRTAKPDPPSSVSEAYGHLPLQFEANQGQTDPQVKFFARGAGYGFYLTNNEAVL